MKPLYEYVGKRVKIIDIYGKEWHGIGDVYSEAVDNEDGVESLAFRMDGVNDALIDLSPNVIRSIEVEK